MSSSEPPECPDCGAWHVEPGSCSASKIRPEIADLVRRGNVTSAALDIRSLLEALDKVREALGQNEAHYLTIADDVRAIVEAVESRCDAMKGTQADSGGERMRTFKRGDHIELADALIEELARNGDDAADVSFAEMSRIVQSFSGSTVEGSRSPLRVQVGTVRSVIALARSR